MKMITASALRLAALILATQVGTPEPAEAYPVDCAILLCLSGGWPASVECAQARAVFIQRITPWPIEPPLQIWNCPMHASLKARPDQSFPARFYDIAFRLAPKPQISQPVGPWLYKVQTTDRADVDISGPEFDFVRSIKVFNIQYNQRRNHDGDCNRSDATQLGTYGTQGDYRWARSTSSAVPASSDFDPPNGCNDYFYRSVFIDWRDYLGNYGSEEVRY